MSHDIFYEKFCAFNQNSILVSNTYYNYIGIHPGEYGCEDSRQCEAFFPHSTCSSEGKCHCPSGYQLQTILFPTGNVQQANNKQSTCVLRK